MKTDWFKEFRVAFLDIALVCAAILWTGFEPTWRIVVGSIGLYFACLILGAVIEAIREARG